MTYPTLSDVASDFDEFFIPAQEALKWALEQSPSKAYIGVGGLTVSFEAIDANGVLIEEVEFFPIIDDEVDLVPLAQAFGY